MSISVVVPVYNTSRYLKECLDSICEQDVEDLEVIAVNDASTDNSLEILKQYAQNEKRLKIIDLENNLGLGPVRNKGIKAARGKWITFLDSDDKYKSGSLVELLNTAEENDSQMVIGSVELQYDLEDGNHRTEQYATSKTLNFHAINTNIDRCQNLINITSSSAIVYSRKFLSRRKILFQRQFQEDHDFGLHAILEADRVSIRGDVPHLVYRKRVPSGRESSITTSPWNLDRFEMMIDHFERVIELLTSKKYRRRIRNIDELQKTRFSYYLGSFSNHILRSVFLNRDNGPVEPLLDRLAAAFEKSNLQQTGLDHEAETLSPNNPERTRSGYYELCLALMLERKWPLLQNLVVNNGLSADRAAEVDFDKSSSDSLKRQVFEFLQNDPSKIIKSKVPLPNIVPHNIDEVIIHIGMTKTGSTAIQNFLETNRDTLKAKGLIYPATGIYHDHQAGSKRTAGHSDLWISISKRNFAFFNLFRSEVSESGCSKLLISCENFFHTKPEVISELRTIVGEVPVKLIAYLRPQDQWIESYYAESIAGGHAKCSLPFDEFLETRKTEFLDYNKILGRWADAFGRKNIVAKPYQGSDIVKDFCNTIGMAEEFDTFSVSTEKSNISPLSRNKLGLLKEMNKLPFANRQRDYQKFVHAFIEEFGSYDKRKKVRWLSEAQRSLLTSEFENSNRQVEKKYCNGKKLFEPHDPGIGSEDMEPGNEDDRINHEDLEKAMTLYLRFQEKAPASGQQNPALAFQPPKSMAAKIYFVSRGVPGLEQVVNWIAPLHDRLFGVAR